MSATPIAAGSRAGDFLSQLLSGASLPRPADGWTARLRSEALERANALSVPTTRDEDWRFTDLAPLTRLAFQPPPEGTGIEHAAVTRFFFSGDAPRLVFVDGEPVPALGAMASGAIVETCRVDSAQAAGALEGRLGTAVRFEDNLFAALNTAFLRDVAVIRLGPGAQLQAPVHILHVATPRAVPHAIYPRLLVVADRDSRATIVEDYVAVGEASYFSSPVTEVLLEPGAQLAHVRVQREARQAFQLATTAVRQGAGSVYRATTLAFGARLSRHELTVVHAGEAAETHLDGLAFLSERQLADTHSFVDHAHRGGRMRQMHKCVVGGGAHAVFNGRILVREGAQQVDARQASRNLLLSDRARVDTKPQLEIFADDVKCAHGATVGQLAQDELFYLRTRGLDERAARRLLTYAFAAEIIERLPVRPLAGALAHLLSEQTT